VKRSEGASATGSRAFVSRQVDRLRPQVGGLANSLIDDFISSGRVDWVTAYAMPIPVTRIAELLGGHTDMAPQLLDWSHRIAAMYQYERNMRIDEQAAAATQKFSGLCGRTPNKTGRRIDRPSDCDKGAGR